MSTCISCGSDLPKNKARCISCKAWNVPGASMNLNTVGSIDGTMLLTEVTSVPTPRLLTGAWDENFGDPPGIAQNSVSLIGGAPGVGKSTLALELMDVMCGSSGAEGLYLGAEEGKSQVNDRAIRLELKHRKLIRILPMENMQTANLENILETRKTLCGVVVDSMPGFTDDVNRAVEICETFKQFAIRLNIPFLVIDHITKGGDMAGLMKLQHKVDTTLLFTKGGKDELFDVEGIGEIEGVRSLYTEKNRFGPSGITTYYVMTAQGLINVDLVEEDDEDDE